MPDGGELGPGRYNQEATYVMASTGAQTVVVIVLGGDRGQGFEVKTLSPTHLAYLPKILDKVARGIEAAAS